MIKINRRPGKRVDFNLETKKPILNKEKDIRKKFQEIKQAEKNLVKIQTKKGKEGIKQKEIELKKIIKLWDDLNRIDLNALEKKNLIKMINSQKNFIKDFLENYLSYTKKRDTKNYKI